MRLNKDVVINAINRIENQEFTFNELFQNISDELQVENIGYPTTYRFHDVIRTVTNLTGITQEKMSSRTRIRGIVDVRQVAMYLVDKYTRLT